MYRVSLGGAIFIAVMLFIVAVTTGIWEIWVVFGINVLLIIILVTARSIKAKKESNDIERYLAIEYIKSLSEESNPDNTSTTNGNNHNATKEL